MKQKTSAWMISSFNKIFEKAKTKPWKLVTDRGLEFTSKTMLTYFKEQDVLTFCNYTSPSFHAGVAERAIRTVKTKLFKWFTENNSTRWIDIIEDIVLGINRSVCRITNMAPLDVTYENASELQKKLFLKEPNPKPNKKIKPGDKVRFVKQRMVFTKGYLPSFTDQIFTVHSVNYLKTPEVFRLRDDTGEILKGYFYRHELCVVTQDENTTYRIEILDQRKSKKGGKDFLVHWLGYDSTENQWIHESDLV